MPTDESKNNVVADSYNPPGVGTDFEPILFEDVSEDDLIWLDNNSLDGMVNVVHKKLDESSAINVQNGQVVNINSRHTVYQKT